MNMAMVLVLQMTATRGMMMNFMVVAGEEMELAEWTDESSVEDW